MLKESSKVMGFGGSICRLRKVMGFTQDEFADFLNLSRCTISKLEHPENSVEQISDELLYRIYYFLQKIIESDKFSQFINYMSNDISETIDNYLKKKIKFPL